jgi:protein-tyrosine-phosphatase
MAEAFYNKKMGSKAAISAGLEDVSAKYGGRPTEDIVQVMAEEGIDISNQKIKQVDESMLAKAEKIVFLCEKGICPKIISDKRNVIYKEVEDPYQKGQEKLIAVKNRIKFIVENL